MASQIIVPTILWEYNMYSTQVALVTSGYSLDQPAAFIIIKSRPVCHQSVRLHDTQENRITGLV